jgi:hypothetical protein
MTSETTDEDIRKEAWNGLLPIVFELTPNEITTLQSPSPYYVKHYILFLIRLDFGT